MIIGVPKEVKSGENRVGVVPAGAQALVDAGHRVLVQAGAGEGSGIDDAADRAAGAEIVADAAAAWGGAELVVKVKEPSPRSTLCCGPAMFSSPICTSRRRAS
jgi:alanine dehydrogenase